MIQAERGEAGEVHESRTWLKTTLVQQGLGSRAPQVVRRGWEGSVLPGWWLCLPC